MGTADALLSHGEGHLSFQPSSGRDLARGGYFSPGLQHLRPAEASAVLQSVSECAGGTRSTFTAVFLGGCLIMKLIIYAVMFWRAWLSIV